MAVNFEPLIRFWCLDNNGIVYFITESAISNRLGVNELMTEVFVEQPLASPGSAKYKPQLEGKKLEATMLK